jgi:N-hydroxyarylamine O-acetyltransferase
VSEPSLPPDSVARYLSFLGLEPEPPSRDALARLVRAQIERSVFENVTAILRRAATPEGPVPPVDPVALVGALCEGRGGGVCFDLAPAFRGLLRGLGYQVQPLLAQISFPGSHHAALVELDDRQYLVDVGGGWPLWDPVAIDESVEIEHAGLDFRLRPGGPGEYLREQRVDGEWQRPVVYDLRPASPEEREAAYQRHQVAGATWVVGNLTMVRSTPDAIHRLRDDELISHTPSGKHVERLVSDADYRRVADEVFGLPNLPVDEAREYLAKIRRV